MAQPVIFPLDIVLERKSVKLLRMSQFGGFVYLARAAILEDFDPFSADSATLQYYARATPKQWQQTQRVILKALQDTLPVIRDAYALACEKKANMVAHGHRANAKRREKLDAKRKQVVKTFNLTEASAQPLPSQPLFYSQKNSESHDSKLVHAIKLQNSAQKIGNKSATFLRD